MWTKIERYLSGYCHVEPFHEVLENICFFFSDSTTNFRETHSVAFVEFLAPLGGFALLFLFIFELYRHNMAKPWHGRTGDMSNKPRQLLSRKTHNVMQ